MKKLLLDQGLPRSTAGLLHKAGWDILHVSDIGMSQSEDAEILSYAITTKGVLVTLDADFHALLATNSKKSCMVIRIREEGLRAEELAKLLVKVWPKVKNCTEAGALVSVTSQSARIRHLPILK